MVVKVALDSCDDSTSKVKLRFEWDWKSAERELRRAHELRADYPQHISGMRLHSGPRRFGKQYASRVQLTRTWRENGKL